MVNIRHYEPTGEVLDAQAEEQFAKDWGTYRKLVVNDYQFHREVYAALHRVLTEDVAGPFRFLDLACGDAQGVVGALRGTRVSHYHGVDLSGPALEMARVALEALPCPVELDQRDFVEAMADRPEPADVAWIGLSLHHLLTPAKLTLMREIRGAVGDAGQLLIYEPTRPDGEDRDAYLARFARVNRPLWSALTAEEWDAFLRHVTDCNFPETVSGWTSLGREAGFAAADQLFVAPTDFYRMFRFHA
jgi:SAM-dependent methyltransferase